MPVPYTALIFQKRVEYYDEKAERVIFPTFQTAQKTAGNLFPSDTVEEISSNIPKHYTFIGLD